MPTILVIDDDSAFRNAMQEMLTGAGYDVVPADDGIEAVRILEKRHSTIDLAIVDLSLPGINGFEIIGAISRRPNGVKIIATTGIYGESHLEAAGSLGAHAVIRKPAPGAKLQQKEWLGAVRQLIGPATLGQSASAMGSPNSDTNPGLERS